MTSSSALKRGRPIRYRPSNPTSSKPPECAGLYYIHDADGSIVYTGQSVNLRRRINEHRRNGKIPEGGYVDCFVAKEGITSNELDSTEKAKINKYNPPLNKRKGGGGRKSPKLNNHLPEIPDEVTISPQPEPVIRRNWIYSLLGYEKVDKAGEIRYKKEPKAVFFMVIELIIKVFIIITFLLSVLGIYLRLAKDVLFPRYLVIGMAVFPIICLLLFHYVRRNKRFSIVVLLTVLLNIALYLLSFPLQIK